MHSSVYLCIFGASCPLYGYSRFGSDIKQPLRTPFGDIILGADHHDRVISGDGAKHAFDGLLIDDAGHILRGAGWRVHDHEITCRGHRCDQSGQHAVICCSVLASGLEAGCSINVAVCRRRRPRFRRSDGSSSRESHRDHGSASPASPRCPRRRESATVAIAR